MSLYPSLEALKVDEFVKVSVLNSMLSTLLCMVICYVCVLLHLDWLFLFYQKKENTYYVINV